MVYINTKLMSLFVVGSLATSLYAMQPSFDCSKVEKNSTEAIICSSEELMKLDNELAGLYKIVLKHSSNPKLLKAEQRGWIKGRNDCWKAENEKKCIADEYKFRINQLKDR